MKEGDRIVSLKKTPVPSTDDTAATLASIKPGVRMPVAGYVTAAERHLGAPDYVDALISYP